MRTLILLCFFTLPLAVFSQLEDHIWYFSTTNKGLFFDYVTNSPVITSEHSPLCYEGNGVASDPATGVLLFYSSDNKVYDALHVVMPNGSAMAGGYTSRTNGIPARYPGNLNRYYLFHNNTEASASGQIKYSVVDMTLPGNGTAANPRGDVVAGLKNVLLANNCGEGMVIVSKPGSQDSWLLNYQDDTDIIRVYRISSGGVSFFAQYSTGVTINDPRTIRYSLESGKFAVMNMYENQACLIGSFNSNTGVVSNCMAIPGTPAGTSNNFWTGFLDCEFSSNGTKLYMSKFRMPSGSGRLYQYDLNNPGQNIALIYSNPGGYDHQMRGMKLAPNNKIYVLYVNNTSNDPRIVGVINSPNLAGTACSYNPNGINMGVSIGDCSIFPDFLPPSGCVTFSTNSPQYSITYDCRLGPDMFYSLPIDSIVNNPCGLNVNVSSIQTLYGAAVVSGNSVSYQQPPLFIPNDQIIIEFCDASNTCHTSVVTINYIYSGPPEPVIWQSGDTLFSDALHSIQWYCDGFPIPGAIESLYIPVQECSYSVSSTFNFCSDTSQPFIWTPVGTGSNYNGIVLYPNPAKDEVFVNIGVPGMYDIRLLDAMGRSMAVKTGVAGEDPLLIGLKGYAAGIYFVRVSAGGRVLNYRFVKTD